MREWRHESIPADIRGEATRLEETKAKANFKF